MRTRVILVFGRAASASRGRVRQAGGTAASDFRNDLRFMGESFRGDQLRVSESGYAVWRVSAKGGSLRTRRLPVSSYPEEGGGGPCMGRWSRSGWEKSDKRLQWRRFERTIDIGQDGKTEILVRMRSSS